MSHEKKHHIDGRYILFPEGGCWEYYRIRGGEVISHTSEANMGTHEAAQDQLAWLADIDLDGLDALEDESVGDILELAGYGRDALVVVCPVCKPD